MPAKVLRIMLDEAMQENGETADDLIFISHPLDLLESIATLDAIQCDYLNGAYGWHVDNSPDKQDMPFSAVTNDYWYYYNDNDFNASFRSWKRDDTSDKPTRWSKEYLEWVRNMSKLRWLEYEIIGKSADRKKGGENADPNEFDCFVKHPVTEKKVKVSVTIKEVPYDDYNGDLMDFEITAIDKNGVDLMKLYTDDDCPER